jgi:hypothetical protein
MVAHFVRNMLAQMAVLIAAASDVRGMAWNKDLDLDIVDRAH